MGDDPKADLVTGQQSQRARGESILDAAAELVLRWGYKRVTIEEVAKRAGIGKGTVYLHWRNREALFYAMLSRETVAVLDHVVELIEADPVTALPHRLLRVLFEDSMRRPLLAGLLTRDTDLLGALVERGTDGPPPDAGVTVGRDYLRLLRETGLARTDITLEHQLYLYASLVNGYCLVQPWLPTMLDLPLAARADAFEYAMRAVFEPPERPDPDVVVAVAPQVGAQYARMRDLIAATVHRSPATGTDKE